VVTLSTILDYEQEEGNTKGKDKYSWAPKPKEPKKSWGLVLQKLVSTKAQSRDQDKGLSIALFLAS
jgi:hypothetical protein